MAKTYAPTFFGYIISVLARVKDAGGGGGAGGGMSPPPKFCGII